MTLKQALIPFLGVIYRRVPFFFFLFVLLCKVKQTLDFINVAESLCSSNLVV